MKLNLLVILLFCSLILFSQPLTLKGRFILEGAKPVDLVEVLLSKKDSLVRTAMLGEEGAFIFSHLSGGAYTLEVKQWGEILYTKNLELNADTDLGSIKITQSQEIQGVVITGNKKLIERKIDRLVFNVENSTAALGGDALDALKVTPGIQVQEDQISMIGKSTMKVMINERVIQLSENDLVNYLKSIPSDNIKSIEIITAPPAKYEAEGNSGLINIVLKTSKKNNWNSYVDGSYKQSKYVLFSENMGVNLNYKKITLNSHISHWDGVNYSQKTHGTVFFPDETIQSGTILKSKVKNNFYGNLDLDYQFTPDFSSGFQVIYNKFNQSLTENNQQYFYRKVSDPLLTETFSTGNSEKENYTINTHAQYKLDSLGNKITLNLDYFKYDTDRDRFFYSENYLNFDKYLPNEDYTAQNTSNQKISNFSGKIDGEQTLKNLKINYGVKIAHTENSSDLGYYEWIKNNPVLQVDKSDSFKYKENIQALYLSGNGKMGEKWEAQLGIRVEATQSSGTSLIVNEKHDYDYVKIFPGAYVLYHIDENNKINFTYTKRVNRPSYSALNPFVRYINQNNTVSGNPYLKPSFSDNLEINYVRKNNWNTSIYFYQAKNAVNAVNYLDDNQVYLATKYEN